MPTLLCPTAAGAGVCNRASCFNSHPAAIRSRVRHRTDRATSLREIAAEELHPFASAPLFLILYMFGQYAAFRARRYRATRTVFRGGRFWMSGSAWTYARKAALWHIATLLSLGLALPWRMAALERYMLQN